MIDFFELNKTPSTYGTPYLNILCSFLPYVFIEIERIYASTKTNIKTTQIHTRITNGKVGHDMAILAEKTNETAINLNLEYHGITND